MVWWMSGVVDVWCGGCPILPKVWRLSGLVDVWCGGCLVWCMSVWWMSYNLIISRPDSCKFSKLKINQLICHSYWILCVGFHCDCLHLCLPHHAQIPFLTIMELHRTMMAELRFHDIVGLEIRFLVTLWTLCDDFAVILCWAEIWWYCGGRNCELDSLVTAGSWEEGRVA